MSPVRNQRAPDGCTQVVALFSSSLLRKIRAAVKLPLAYLGGIKSLANAEQAVAEGFECVVLARALLHDPALINKFKSGELTQSGCDNCNGCVAYIYHPAGTRCVYNPPNDLALNLTPASLVD